MAVSIQKRLMTSWQGVSSQQGFGWESSSPQLGWVHHLHLTFSTGHSYDLCQAKQSPAWSLVRFDILPFWFLGDPIWCHVFRYVWSGWRDFKATCDLKSNMIWLYCWHCLTQWRNLNLNSFLLDAMSLYHVVRQTKKPPELSLYSLVHTALFVAYRCLSNRAVLFHFMWYVRYTYRYSWGYCFFIHEKLSITFLLSSGAELASVEVASRIVERSSVMDQVLNLWYK